MPKVSVLTSMYNSNPEYLKENIESILNQTFTDFEYILLNDSPDNKEIEKIVKSYNDPRIKYIVNEKNLGIAESRNRLLDESNGEYLAFFDHDDISFPYRLEKQVKFLDKNPEIGVVSGHYITNKKNHNIVYPIKNRDIKTNLVVRGCVVMFTAAMVRKSVLTKNNIRWEKDYEPADDYRLWAQLIDKTMFHNLKKPLVMYRVHTSNTTHTVSKKMIDRELLVKNELWRKFPYLAQKSSITSWIKLFGIIPLVRIKSYGNNTKYLLFGIIPLIKVIK